MSNSHSHGLVPPEPQLRRGFSPPWPVTVGAVLLCALFIRLGFWQWDKGNIRQEQWSKFSSGTGEAVALGARGLSELPRFQRVTVVGRFEPEHQFLLDNRTNNGNPGYEVLTPFDRPNGRTILVDRGWVPFTGSRARLPDVSMGVTGAQRRESPEAPMARLGSPVTLSGRSDELPSAGLELGRAPPPPEGGWPKVTSYPNMSELSTALGGRPLDSRIVLLDPKEPDGYVREWRPPGMQPVRHWSYAVQWWCFAVATLVFWAVIGRRAASIRGTAPR